MNESAHELSGVDSVPQHRQARVDWLIVATLVLGTLAMYTPTARFDFVNLDDGPYVYGSDHVLGGLTGENIVWAVKTGWPAYWHPLTLLSLMLDVQVFGNKPGPMHIHNAVLHALNSALLFVALFRMTGARWRSAWVAAMFAWHPLHVESVAWISERKDVLSGFFLLLCVLSYIGYVHRNTRGSYLLVLAMLALGLMSKPMLVTTPILLILLDIWPLRRFEKRALKPLVVEKIPMVALAIACAVTTILVQQLLGAIRNDPWSARLANATVSCGRYLWMTIVPKGLAIFYPMHTRLLNGHIPAWQIILSGATLATLTLIVALLYKRVPALLVGWMWYVVALVPVIGLMQSGDQSHADRFTYIPLIGIFAAVAWAIEALTRGRAALRNIAAMIAVATLVGALIVSSRQIGYWRDTTTVMTRAIDVVPNNYVAHRNIGEWYDGHGETARAEAEYHETLRIKPDDVSALQHLAAHAMKAGDDAEAIRLFREALFADPGNGDIYNDYANLLAKQGKTADAIAVYRAGIKRAPSVKELYHNLALLLGEQGAMNDAIPLWQQAIQLDPNYVDAHASLGTAQVMTGQTRRGLAELQTALKLQPDRIDALKSRAWILATHPSALYQNGAEAQVLASRAVELTHRDDPIALDILAASQARNGKFEDAIKSAEDAAELARMQDQRSLLAQIQRRIEIYRSRKAFTSG